MQNCRYSPFLFNPFLYETLHHSLSSVYHFTWSVHHTVKCVNPHPNPHPPYTHTFTTGNEWFCAKNKTGMSTLISWAASDDLYWFFLICVCDLFSFRRLTFPWNGWMNEFVTSLQCQRWHALTLKLSKTPLFSLRPFSNGIRREYNTVKYIHCRRKGVGTYPRMWGFSFCFSLVLIIRQCPLPSKIPSLCS